MSSEIIKLLEDLVAICGGLALDIKKIQKTMETLAKNKEVVLRENKHCDCIQCNKPKIP